MDLKKKKIVITGASGFFGSHVVDRLINIGISQKHIFTPSHRDYDLTKLSSCKKVAKMGDVIIHMAGMVGGIGLNREKPGTMFYKNAMAGIQLIEEARKAEVEKVVIIGTVCAYPKFTPVPFKEKDLWNGYPEETNAPYGLAKKMLLVQSQAYRQEFGFNSIYLLPVNLYGPRDNFDPKSSHVIPALIRKMDEAIKNNQKEVVVWGDGTPTREFLFVEDAARGVVLAAEKYDKPDPVNLGSGFEISIKNLNLLIAKIMGYKGRIVFDKNQPNGQPRRKLDTSKAFEEFGFKATIGFENGLKKTIKWYLNQQSKK